MSEVGNIPSIDKIHALKKVSVSSIWNGTANICGVLGLIITVAWTFPSELWSAYFSSQVKMEQEIQDAISGMATVYKEFTLAQSTNLGDQAKLMLQNVALVQMGHHLDKISSFPDDTFSSASYFQNLALAGLAFQAARYDAALRFNKTAVVAARREDIQPVEAYSGQANSLIGRDGTLGIDAARDAYKLALKAAWKRQRTGRADQALAPLGVLIEVSIAEMRNGSWDCGNTLASVIELQLTKPELRNSAQTHLAVFRSLRATLIKTEEKVPFSCDYLAAAIP